MGRAASFLCVDKTTTTVSFFRLSVNATGLVRDEEPQQQHERHHGHHSIIQTLEIHIVEEAKLNSQRL
jgi:hypothetical protein